MRISRTYGITVYDAAFVALALNLKATFVTADAKMAQRLALIPQVRFLGDLGM